ncbi:MAG TPA: hypothetical protein VNZ22_17420 [Bacillota bacterium]|nr:hypothetical protein [Bacillota bacterium]
MNDKRKRTKKNAAGPGPCLCQGMGPALSEALRRLGPPEEARRHFEAARLEFLKGLRVILDARIEQVSKRAAKGEKIPVE